MGQIKRERFGSHVPAYPDRRTPTTTRSHIIIPHIPPITPLLLFLLNIYLLFFFSHLFLFYVASVWFRPQYYRHKNIIICKILKYIALLWRAFNYFTQLYTIIKKYLKIIYILGIKIFGNQLLCYTKEIIMSCDVCYIIKILLHFYHQPCATISPFFFFSP